MSILRGKKKSPRDRITEIGHTVSAHTADVGHKAREEFDELAPKVVDKISRRSSRRAAQRQSRGRTAFLLTAVGSAALWLMWWKRSGTKWDPRVEDVVADREPADNRFEGFTGA